MNTKRNPIRGIDILLGVFLVTLLILTASAETQFTNEFWISTVVQTNGGTNGVYGSGTLDCPYDGSTQDRFDHVMHKLCGVNWYPPVQNTTIHILAGIYQTLGSYTIADQYRDTIGWRLQNGQKLLGSGIDNTIIQLVNSAGSGSHVIGSYPINCSNIVVADLMVDCNYNPALGAVSYGGIDLAGTGHTVRRVKVINVACADPDPRCGEVAAIGINGNGMNSEGNIIEDCESYSAPGQCADGMGFVGSNDGSSWASGILRNNRMIFTPITNQVGGWTTIACGGAWMRNSLFEGNYIKGANRGFYGDTGGYTNIIVSHNVFENCGYGVLLLEIPRQNLMFCYNTFVYTISNLYGTVFDFAGTNYNSDGTISAITYYTNISFIGNIVIYNGTPSYNSPFLNVANIIGLVVANNTVEASLPNRIAGCANVSIYNNYDLQGNFYTNLNQVASPNGTTRTTVMCPGISTYT
jgi:hypothetical protein